MAARADADRGVAREARCRCRGPRPGPCGWDSQSVVAGGDRSCRASTATCVWRVCSSSCSIQRSANVAQRCSVDASEFWDGELVFGRGEAHGPRFRGDDQRRGARDCWWGSQKPARKRRKDLDNTSFLGSPPSSALRRICRARPGLAVITHDRWRQRSGVTVDDQDAPKDGDLHSPMNWDNRSPLL